MLTTKYQHETSVTAELDAILIKILQLHLHLDETQIESSLTAV